MGKKGGSGIRDIRDHIYTAAAVLCFIAAVFFFCGCILSDRSYDFDMAYAEHNPDSLVVNCFNLRQGSFVISFDYDTDYDTAAQIQADNDKAFDVPLNAAESHAEMPFSLAHPTDRFKIAVPLDDSGSITIQGIGLRSGTFPIYTDKLVWMLIFLAAGAVLLIYRKKWKEMSGEAQNTVIFLILLVTVVNIPYYQKALGFTADIRAHMQRIEGIMRGLMDRQFPVIVSPNLMNEFGEISFLYPDIFLYPFGILRILGVSMLTAYRLCMFCVNAATVLIAFVSFRLICRNKLTVCAATLLITFEPYRLYNMLGRGSGAGNAIASAFLPLVIAGVYLVLKGDRRWWVLSLGMTGVIESHVLTLVLLLSVLVIIGLVMIGELVKDGKYLLLLKAAGLTLIMNAGFLIIFLKCYFTDWSSAALEWSDFADSSFGISGAFTSTWSLFEIIMAVLCIYCLIRTKNRKGIQYKLSFIMTVIGGLLYIMTLRLFPWGSLIRMSNGLDRVTTMLQVPQRIYAVSSVMFICSLTLLTDREPVRADEQWKAMLLQEKAMSLMLGCMLIFGTVYAFGDYYSAAPLMPDEVYGDHNSLPLKDYIPSGTVDEAWSTDAGYVSDEELVESLDYRKNGTHIDYTYVSHGGGTYANMPLLYYKWYRAKDENGDPLTLRKSEDGRVIVELIGDGSRHEAHICFDMGIVFSALYILSLAFSLRLLRLTLQKGMWRLDE